MIIGKLRKFAGFDAVCVIITKDITGYYMIITRFIGYFDFQFKLSFIRNIKSHPVRNF